MTGNRFKLIGIVWMLAIMNACGGSTSMPTGPSTPSSAVPTPTVLRTLYRVLVNGSDRMTSVGSDERNIFPLEGQIYHVPDQPATGRNRPRRRH